MGNIMEKRDKEKSLTEFDKAIEVENLVFSIERLVGRTKSREFFGSTEIEFYVRSKDGSDYSGPLSDLFCEEIISNEEFENIKDPIRLFLNINGYGKLSIGYLNSLLVILAREAYQKMLLKKNQEHRQQDTLKNIKEKLHKNHWLVEKVKRLFKL